MIYNSLELNHQDIKKIDNFITCVLFLGVFLTSIRGTSVDVSFCLAR